MHEKIKQVLENLGFEEREIKVYIALLKEQNLTALKIAKKTSIDRTTTYDILERLMNKGVASSFIQNKIKHFKVLTPKQLLVYFKEKFYSLENIIPSLNQLKDNSHEVVKCELLQGKNGFKTVIRDFTEANTHYKTIGIRKEYEEILGYLTDQYVLRLNTLNVKEKAIVEEGSKFVPLKYGTYRYLKKKLLPPITTLIYNNVVIFFIWKEPYFAIRIENKEFAKLQSEYFDLLWDVAKGRNV
jgi:HTH-type transcriptional regulator, sugar sensing transcriptional regulator